MKKSIYLSLGTLLLSLGVYAQVGIGTTKPEGALHVTSPDNNMGLVLPTSDNPSNIINPQSPSDNTAVVAGTLFFDTSDNCVKVRLNNKSWSKCMYGESGGGGGDDSSTAVPAEWGSLGSSCNPTGIYAPTYTESGAFEFSRQPVYPHLSPKNKIIYDKAAVGTAIRISAEEYNEISKFNKVSIGNNYVAINKDKQQKFDKDLNFVYETDVKGAVGHIIDGEVEGAMVAFRIASPVAQPIKFAVSVTQQVPNHSTYFAKILWVSKDVMVQPGDNYIVFKNVAAGFKITSNWGGIYVGAYSTGPLYIAPSANNQEALSVIDTSDPGKLCGTDAQFDQFTVRSVSPNPIVGAVGFIISQNGI